MKETVLRLESQVREQQANLAKLQDKHKKLHAMLEEGMHNSKSATEHKTLNTIKQYVEITFNL